MNDDLDNILSGKDPLADGWGDVTPDTAPGHHGAVTRAGTPWWLPGLAFRLYLWPVCRWLDAGRTAACSCGWRQAFASAREADHRLADHVTGRGEQESTA